MWGSGALISGLTGLIFWGPKPHFSGALGYAREHARLASQMFGEFVISSGAQQGIIFLVPLVATLYVLGSYKAAQGAVGPLGVVLLAGSIAALPTLARSARDGRYKAVIREARNLAFFNLAVGLTCALVLFVLPVSIGRVFLGRSWISASAVAPIVAIQVTFIGVCKGAMIAMQATRNVRRSLGVRVITAPMMIIGSLLGAYFWGLFGLASGLAIGTIVAAAMWWLTVMRIIGNMKNDIEEGNGTESISARLVG
jgi:O-antigen/teichoic acid export membrane protein